MTMIDKKKSKEVSVAGNGEVVPRGLSELQDWDNDVYMVRKELRSQSGKERGAKRNEHRPPLEWMVNLVNLLRVSANHPAVRTLRHLMPSAVAQEMRETCLIATKSVQKLSSLVSLDPSLCRFHNSCFLILPSSVFPSSAHFLFLSANLSLTFCFISFSP